MPAGDPISSLSDLINLATGGGGGSPEKIVFSKKMNVAGGGAAGGFIAGYPSSLWRYDGQPAGATAIPSTASVCTNATTGALGQTTSAAGAHKRILSLFALLRANSSQFATVILYDRLAHQGGLSGTTTGAQTTNLPTAALTRHTSGLGVEPFLEIYSTIGVTGTTATVSYTNDAGTSGQTSTVTSFGATSFREAERLVVVPLAAGDRGIRAVASATVLATTGTTGNFGVTLGYPLIVSGMVDAGCMASMEIPLRTIGGPLSLGTTSDACLAFAIVGTTALANFELFGTLDFIEK